MQELSTPLRDLDAHYCRAGVRGNLALGKMVRAPVAGLALVTSLLALQPTPVTAGALSCQDIVVNLVEQGRARLEGVTFEFNRASLRPESLPQLIAARDAILSLGGTWMVEGHTDNVGSRDYNLRLSETRAQAVRDWLAAAGVPAGQLAVAGYAFDRPVADNETEAGRAQNRRVELVAEVTPDMLGFGGPAEADPCPATLTPGIHAEGATAGAEAPPPPPPITEWTGSGGQEWLPFSHLMATGFGTGSGWSGEVITMPPGTQPQACQALCWANDQCAAFSFNPGGSYFIEDARCHLIGYGSERDLTRDNTYFADGAFFASGLKPDARILTPESEALAAEILADLAEIAGLRARARLTAAAEAAPGAPIDVALDGHVPAERYASLVEIADLDDYDFSWWKSRASLFVHDMADGRSGQIAAPGPGDYVLRYVIDHPTAGRHTIVAQPLTIVERADATIADPAGNTGQATLSAPMVLAPGEAFTVTYTGPLFNGDWIDIITPGNDDDMSGGWGWAWATGAPVSLTAPQQEGDYTLRYVAEDPARGRTVLARETLVVRATPATTVPDEAIVRRCEGAMMTPCEITLPESDLALTLIAGYGITEPLAYTTAAGIRAERPSFDVVRLSDGAVVIAVNERQGGGTYCQELASGDRACITPAYADADGMLAGVVFASLTSASMQAETMAADEEETILPGAMQGIWAVMVREGHPKAGKRFLRLDLFQDMDEDAVSGSFNLAGDFDPMPHAGGALEGRQSGDSVTLTLLDDMQRGAPVLKLDRWADEDWLGTFLVGRMEIPVHAMRVARPGDDDWDEPLSWSDRDPMAEALQIGAEVLQGLLGDNANLSPEDRAAFEMMGRIMGGAAAAMGAETPAPGADAPAGDLMGMLGAILGANPQSAPRSPAGAGAAPAEAASGQDTETARHQTEMNAGAEAEINAARAKAEALIAAEQQRAAAAEGQASSIGQGLAAGLGGQPVGAHPLSGHLAASPQLEPLGGTPLDLTAEEALRLIAPHRED
ncbi:OmpA family protein [Paracoccus bogoriensis]|uniref:OmpA family protein n=1 Tax=Paracoccus bogoriensis TaxID=242065 RepID=UPI001CA4BBB3|nr:OmpA family protein [Paracoccus bogoriensis]MBW7057328.1 OmpA family protein [Paracoccus bogoriensis]